MKPEDLARECIRSIETQGEASFIVLHGKLPQKGWPRGKILGSDAKGNIYAYDAAKVLVRLLAMKVCRLVPRSHPLWQVEVAPGEVSNFTLDQTMKVADAWYEFTKTSERKPRAE